MQESLDVFKLKKPSLLQNYKPNKNNIETSFIWHIKNFEMCPDKCGKPLKSPEFSIYNWQNPKFYILLYPGGVNEKSSKYISAYLVCTNEEVDFTTYSCNLGIVTKNDKLTCHKFYSTEFTRGSGKGNPEFFEKEKLQLSERDTFLPDGNLTIFCDMNSLKAHESLSYGSSSQLKDLSDIYEGIYKNEKYCDVFLHAGEKTFKAHKAILEARYPTLLKNIDGNKCKIEGISSTTMKALLNYLYTGFININELNLFEIISSNYTLPSNLKCLLLEQQSKVEVTTFFQKTSISFSWNIQNFGSLDSGKIIHYPLIGDYNIKWTWLDIFLSVETDESDDEYITISIQRFSKDCKRIICKIEASDVSKTFNHTYNKEDKWKLPNFLSKDMLESTDSDETLDDFNLNFEIEISDGSKTIEFGKKELILNSSSINQSAEDLKSFQKDLITIPNNPKYCDVTLIAGKEKFPAHKFILSARSSLFDDMFDSESAKKKNFEVVFDDIDSYVVKDMLAYMYCNEVKFSLSGFKYIHCMYSAASKYNLSGLKDECVTSLKSNLTAETAGEMLISADKWNDEELKELVYNYVCTYPLEIANSKEWEQVMLKRSDLASDVLKMTLYFLAAKNKIINIETD